MKRNRFRATVVVEESHVTALVHSTVGVRSQKTETYKEAACIGRQGCIRRESFTRRWDYGYEMRMYNRLDGHRNGKIDSCTIASAPLGIERNNEY